MRICQSLAYMAYVNLECKWKLRPKTHAFAHLCVELPSTLENPARQNLLWAEDAIGKAKHIAIHCHRTLAPLRDASCISHFIGGNITQSMASIFF